MGALVANFDAMVVNEVSFNVWPVYICRRASCCCNQKRCLTDVDGENSLFVMVMTSNEDGFCLASRDIMTMTSNARLKEGPTFATNIIIPY